MNGLWTDKEMTIEAIADQAGMRAVSVPLNSVSVRCLIFASCPCHFLAKGSTHLYSSLLHSFELPHVVAGLTRRSCCRLRWTRFPTRFSMP